MVSYSLAVNRTQTVANLCKGLLEDVLVQLSVEDTAEFKKWAKLEQAKFANSITPITALSAWILRDEQVENEQKQAIESDAKLEAEESKEEADVIPSAWSRQSSSSNKKSSKTRD